MAFIASLTVDAEGKLWVAEGDMMPKRFSCWDIQSGKLVKEFFGPTTYGAGRGDQPARPVPDGRTRLRMAHRSADRPGRLVWA